MAVWTAKLILKIFFGKEVDIMMAMLWAQAIMDGRKTFKQVPRLLKEDVRIELIASGKEELIIE